MTLPMFRKTSQTRSLRVIAITLPMSQQISQTGPLEVVHQVVLPEAIRFLFGSLAVKSASRCALAVVNRAAEAISETEELAVFYCGRVVIVQLVAAVEFVVGVSQEGAAQIGERAPCKHGNALRYAPLTRQSCFTVPQVG